MRVRAWRATDVSGPVDPVEVLIVQGDPADNVVTAKALKIHKVANRFHLLGGSGAAIDFLRRAGEGAGPQPDLVLLDLDLPDSDGRAVLRYLSDHPSLAGIPVVVLASGSAEEARLRAQPLPVQGYSRKPVDFDTLAAVVRAQASLGFTAWRRS